MQSDPLSRILTNIDSICQSAVIDFEDDGFESNNEILTKLEEIRQSQHTKIGKRIADLCNNIIRSVGMGNIEFRSQVLNLVKSVSNIIIVYESSPNSAKSSTAEKSAPNESAIQATIEQYEDEIKELKRNVNRLEEQAALDKAALSKLQTQSKEFELIERDNECLKYEVTRFQDKLDRLEQQSVDELSSIKRSVAESGRQIEELEEELALAHKARHQQTVSAQAAIADFRTARQNQEAAEAKLKDVEARLKESLAANKDLECQAALLSDQLASACLTRGDSEAKIQELESQLRGLDKAEAAMVSALRAKAFAESRTAKLETDYATLARQRDSLQSELRDRDSDIQRLKLSKDLSAREMHVLQAEVTALGHALAEKKAQLAEATMTVNSQHNQIVLNTVQQMEWNIREQDLCVQLEQTAEKLAAAQDEAARLQSENGKVMGLLMAAQERLLEVQYSHDTFNTPESPGGGGGIAAAPIVANLFARAKESVGTIRENIGIVGSNIGTKDRDRDRDSGNNSMERSTAGGGGGSNSGDNTNPVGGGGRSITPPRTSLFNMMQKRTASTNNLHSVAANETARNTQTAAATPTTEETTSATATAAVATTTTGTTDEECPATTAIIEDLRRKLRAAVQARHESEHAAEMTVAALKTELATTRDQLEEHQSRRESKRDYQELMRLRLQYRELEAALATVTQKYDAMVASAEQQQQQEQQQEKPELQEQLGQLEQSEPNVVVIEGAVEGGTSGNGDNALITDGISDGVNNGSSDRCRQTAADIEEPPSSYDISAVAPLVQTDTADTALAEAPAENRCAESTASTDTNEANVPEDLSAVSHVHDRVADESPAGEIVDEAAVTTVNGDSTADETPSLPTAQDAKEAAVIDSESHSGAGDEDAVVETTASPAEDGDNDEHAVVDPAVESSEHYRSESMLGGVQVESTEADSSAATETVVASTEPVVPSDVVQQNEDLVQEPIATEVIDNVAEAEDDSPSHSVLPPLLQRRFVSSSSCPVVYLEISQSELRLGEWRDGQIVLCFACPTYVAEAKEGFPRDRILALMEETMQQADTDKASGTGLDPSTAEFFEETGLVLGREAEFCLGSGPRHERLAAMFNRRPLLTAGGHISHRLGLCYAVLHCALKGLGLEELAHIQLLCRCPGTFGREDRDALRCLLQDDLSVGKTYMVEENQLVTAGCLAYLSLSQCGVATDSALVVDVGQAVTTLYPVYGGSVQWEGVVSCAAAVAQDTVDEHYLELLVESVARSMSGVAAGDVRCDVYANIVIVGCTTTLPIDLPERLKALLRIANVDMGVTDAPTDCSVTVLPAVNRPTNAADAGNVSRDFPASVSWLGAERLLNGSSSTVFAESGFYFAAECE